MVKVEGYFRKLVQWKLGVCSPWAEGNSGFWVPVTGDLYNFDSVTVVTYSVKLSCSLTEGTNSEVTEVTQSFLSKGWLNLLSELPVADPLEALLSEQAAPLLTGID